MNPSSLMKSTGASGRDSSSCTRGLSPATEANIRAVLPAETVLLLGSPLLDSRSTSDSQPRCNYTSAEHLPLSGCQEMTDEIPGSQ